MCCTFGPLATKACYFTANIASVVRSTKYNDGNTVPMRMQSNTESRYEDEPIVARKSGLWEPGSTKVMGLGHPAIKCRVPVAQVDSRVMIKYEYSAAVTDSSDLMWS